ncbi:Transcription factor domain, fungi [Lasallia pustulata]|uniref:Transcription factor domain, fungi n=1 Tax=Lasallia pustulata TaxID=136370 RepID=A0A1W5DCG7_9LECA|nr:Transcription factor domain, fungi [Lasallia pustulata]
MQNRINRLEGLVLSLMTNGDQSVGPAAAARALSQENSTGSTGYSQAVDVNGRDTLKEEGEEIDSESDLTTQLGILRVDNNKSLYVGEAHWATVLHHIAEVKNYFADHAKQYEDQLRKVQASTNAGDFSQRLGFLFAGTQLPDYTELLASLPSREITDRLVTRFFSSVDAAVRELIVPYYLPHLLTYNPDILHPASFQRLYNQHWAEPMKTGPTWLGQLFAILGLAMQSYHRQDDEPPEFQGQSLILACKYRALTAQCLLLADFTKPVNHMIETLTLHLNSEFNKNRDSEVAIWVLVGMIVRLAMRMGYHRDPKHFPKITPFQGEIRRRVWTYVRQCDILFSFQMGLPSMIRQGDCDTDFPRNLYDDEFDEETKLLPPSRPMSVQTPSSYLIAKGKLVFAFSKVVESLHSVSSCPYENIMSLDDYLQETNAALPPYLRLRSLEESMADPVDLVIQRFALSILYNKSQCVLHRKFLARARENNRYTHSRRTCVDSALELLHHQRVLHYESKPGRRLHSAKWFTSSLTSHDFLLAAMIICLDGWIGNEAEIAARISGDMYTFGLERGSDMIQALEISQRIWAELRDQSIEAYKASEILKLMLDARKTKCQQNPSRQAYPSFAFSNESSDANRTANYAPQEEEKPEHSAAMTLGMLSTGGISPNTSNLFSSSFMNAPLPANGVTMSEAPSSGASLNYTADQSKGPVPSTLSPFSFLGSGPGIMDVSPANLDWDAWDNYIQNPSFDPANQMWPTSLDLPVITTAADGQGDLQEQLQSQQNQYSGAFMGSSGVFMGVNTSPAI